MNKRDRTKRERARSHIALCVCVRKKGQILNLIAYFFRCRSIKTARQQVHLSFETEAIVRFNTTHYSQINPRPKHANIEKSCLVYETPKHMCALCVWMCVVSKQIINFFFDRIELHAVSLNRVFYFRFYDHLSIYLRV